MKDGTSGGGATRRRGTSGFIFWWSRALAGPLLHPPYSTPLPLPAPRWDLGGTSLGPRWDPGGTSVEPRWDLGGAAVARTLHLPGAHIARTWGAPCAHLARTLRPPCAHVRPPCAHLARTLRPPCGHLARTLRASACGHRQRCLWPQADAPRILRKWQSAGLVGELAVKKNPAACNQKSSENGRVPAS